MSCVLDEREGERECVCVWVREREREREREKLRAACAKRHSLHQRLRVASYIEVLTPARAVRNEVVVGAGG